jgi:ribosomal protein S18 acetylase RimI-like enzyme
VIRRLQTSDRPAWLRFLADIPEGEERFFKEDLADATAFERWTQRPGWLVAVENAEIVGSVAALPGTGWSRHVAELRLIVAGSRRGHGLGCTLARDGLMKALELGCSHVYVEVIAAQGALIDMFRKLGFQPEALLNDFVRDGDGNYHDLMLLTHRADENWSALAGLGLADGVS